MNKPFCNAPWVALTIGENGDVKTCCAGTTVLGNVNADYISNIVKNIELDHIKEKLSLNQFTENCSSCYIQEKKTGTSLREQYANFELSNTLKLLDVRWSNLCNLACIYCSDQFSSVWEVRTGKQRVIRAKEILANLKKLINHNLGTKLTKTSFLNEIDRHDKFNKYKFNDLWKEEFLVIENFLK